MRLATLCFLIGFFAMGCAHGKLPADPHGLALESSQLALPPPPAPSRLRIVTFNVHFGKKTQRIAAALRAQAELAAADVVLLQEIQHHFREPTSRARELAQALSMHYVYAPARPIPEGGTHGVAILSRFPLRDLEVIELPGFKIGGSIERRIALAGTLDLPGHPIRIFNVHLDTRLNPAQRIEQLRAVVKAADVQPLTPAVVGGDFNTNPFRWLSQRTPIGRVDQAGAVDRFMTASGFIAPTAGSGSTITCRVLHMRLDSLYVRGLPAESFAVERKVDVSDHLPLWLDIRVPQEPSPVLPAGR